MNCPILISILIFCSIYCIGQTTPSSSDQLVGLWKAKRSFGPYARGPLVIQRTGEKYTADMIGRRVPMKEEKGELSFDLPNGQGSFKGRFVGAKTLEGHWYPPANSAELIGFKFASPVQLKHDGNNRWSGDVVPFDDEFTLYLHVWKLPDGSLSALLRNPDRNYAYGIVNHIVRDGDSVRLIGRRPGQKEDSKIFRGTYDPDNDMITLSIPNRGGTYDFKRDDDESDFYPRGKNPDKYVYHPPLARDDGWKTGTLDDANISQAGIEKFIQMIMDAPMDSVQAVQVDGILIARHSKLVLEEYFHGQNRDKLHDTRSAAKVITATMVGAVMQQGAPLTENSPVYKVMNGGSFPEDLDSLKKAMTLENLLTMSSGFFCDDDNPDAPGNENTMIDNNPEPDYYKFTLRLPMIYAPGEKAVYCSINPNLALGMVTRVMGESPMYTFDRLIGAPLKITRYAWVLDPAGHPYGGGSVQLLPRDFMKIGQLMLNGGTWEGHRILSKNFVKRASSPLYNLNGNQYGYLWWSINYPYKNRTIRAFYAAGNGGQGIMVIPELDLVIGTFGGNYGMRMGRKLQQEYPPNYILPSVREPGDDKNAPVVWGTFVNPYGPFPNSGTRITK